MPVIKVKDKYQVTLPAGLRKKLKLQVGDLLEAEVKGGKLTLSPKSLVDREIALGLKDIREGRYIGPFESADQAVRALHRHARTTKRR